MSTYLRWILAVLFIIFVVGIIWSFVAYRHKIIDEQNQTNNKPAEQTLTTSTATNSPSSQPSAPTDNGFHSASTAPSKPTTPPVKKVVTTYLFETNSSADNVSVSSGSASASAGVDENGNAWATASAE